MTPVEIEEFIIWNSKPTGIESDELINIILKYFITISIKITQIITNPKSKPAIILNEYLKTNNINP